MISIANNCRIPGAGIHDPVCLATLVQGDGLQDPLRHGFGSLPKGTRTVTASVCRLAKDVGILKISVCSSLLRFKDLQPLYFYTVYKKLDPGLNFFASGSNTLMIIYNCSPNITARYGTLKKLWHNHFLFVEVSCRRSLQ